MKCIWRWKQKPISERLEDYRVVAQRALKAIEENPDEFPEIGPSIHTGMREGFRLLEGTYEQMRNLMAIWSPVDDWKLEVYFECPPWAEIVQRWRSYE